MLDLPKHTVNKILIKLKQSDYSVKKVITPLTRKYGKRKVIGSVKQEQYFISEECLRKWAHLSIIKRVELIRKKWNIEVSGYKLRKLYSMHKIKWRRAYYTMKGETKD